MNETKKTGGAMMAIYSIASEIVTVPLVEPVKQAQFRTRPPERNANQAPKKDTVTLSSQALQLARDEIPADEE